MYFEQLPTDKAYAIITISEMYLETIIILFIALLLAYVYIQKKWTVLRKWNVPHDPPTLLNLGHALLLFRKDGFKYELQCKKKFGNIWGFYSFTRPRIVVHDVEVLRQIMVKEFSTFPNRLAPPDKGIRGLEEGLLFAEGRKWKRIRSSLAPTFTNTKLKAMSGLVNWCIGNMMQNLDKRVSNGNALFRPRNDFYKLSLDIICSTSLSIDLNSQDDSQPVPEVAKHAGEIFYNNLFDKIMLFVKLSFPTLRNVLGEGRHGKNFRYMKSFIQAIINDRADNTDSARSDILNGMLNVRKSKDDIKRNPTAKGMSDAEISQSAITMLLAGFETTGTSMTYLAYNLAMHCNVQQRLQLEIDKAFSDKDGIDFETASGIKYLDMCIRESLRLYCAVGKTMRCTGREMVIGDVRCPRGVSIYVPIASLCQDPDYWNNPTEFNPDRMEYAHELDPVIYQPFGCGPRNCIGLKFAVTEMKLTFCTILKKYSILPTDGTPKPPLSLTHMITSSPISDIKLKILRR